MFQFPFMQQQSPFGQPLGQPQPRGMLGRLAYPSSSAGTQLQNIGFPSREFDQMLPQMGFGMSGGFMRQPGPPPSLQPMAMLGTPPPIMSGNMRGQQDFTKPNMGAVGSMQALPQMAPGGVLQTPKEPSMWDQAGQSLGDFGRQMMDMDLATRLQMAGAFFDAASGNSTPGDAFIGASQALEGQQQRALRKEQADYTRSRREREKVLDERQDVAYTATQQELLDAKKAKDAALADPALSEMDRRRIQAAPLSEIAKTMALLNAEKVDEARRVEDRTTLTAAQQAQINQQNAELAAEQSYRNRALGLDARRLAIAERAAANGPSFDLSNIRGADRAQLEDVRQAAANGQQLLALSDMFQKQNAQAYTGPGGDLQFWDKNIGGMNQISSVMRGMMRPPNSGSTTDFEQRLYALGAPSPNNTKEVNDQIINNWRVLGQIAMDRRDFQEQYLMRNGHLIGAEQAFQASPLFQRNLPPEERKRYAPAATQGQGGYGLRPAGQPANLGPGGDTDRPKVVPRVRSPAEAAVLPSGMRFIDENGVERIKR